MIRFRKKFIVVALTLAVTFFVFNSPQPAKALLGVGDQTFTTIVADPLRSIWNAAQKAYTAIKDKIGAATAIAFKNSTRTFLATVTQQFATSLATAGPGQKPLFLTNPKTFFRDVTDAAAGDFIDDFTKGVTGGTWDERCDSKIPEVRKQCVGIIGGTTSSGGTLSQQSRFIISRLLRAGSQGTLDSCLEEAKTNYGVVNETPFTYAQAQNSAGYSSVTGYNNEHEKKAALMRAWIETANVGTKALKAQDPNQGVVCRDVFDSTGSVYHLGDTTYAITPGVCAPGSESPLGWECNVTAQECYNRQMQALDNELEAAGKELSTEMSKCGSQFGNAARSWVNKATATDIFSYVENYDIRNSPKEIAIRFSGKSDISQYFSAAATLASTIETKVTGESTYLSSGTLPKTTKVSQQVQTPKEATSALFGIPFYTSSGELTYTGNSAADILSGVASFLNSPVGKALFTYFSSKCGLNPDSCKGATNPTSTIGKILFNSTTSGLAAAREQLAGLGEVDIITGNPGSDEVDILSQLSSAGLIDTQFQKAISEGLTVREALKQGLLSGDKVVGYTSKGVEPEDGYPYRSLQYLRKYRIIPVGWELAAKYNLRFSSQSLTLNTLIAHYDMCGQDAEHKVCSSSLNSCQDASGCNDGETCGASPYCGLVDPDWVLKAPQTYCRRLGAGEEIISKEFVCDQNNVDKETGETIPNGTTCVASSSDPEGTASCHDVDAANCVYNAETNPNPDIGRWVITRNNNICGDSQSCLAEDDDGNCLAYGYCMQERQTYKFDGDSCQSQESTCTTYTSTSGTTTSYLAKNLDFSCDANSAGCQWYCAKPSYDETTKSWTCNNTSGTKVYMTSQAQECTSSQVGCSEFIRLVSGTNYLPNGGFEIYEGGEINSAPAMFTGWTSGLISLTPVTPSDSQNVNSNNTAVSVLATDSSDTISQTVNLGAALSGRTFTFSLRAKASDSCSGTVRLCTGTDCGGTLHPEATMDIGQSWSGYSVTLAVPSSAVMNIPTTRLHVEIQPGGCRESGLVIDSAQLQEAAGISSFIEYGQSNLVYLNGERRSCQPADVGCDKYTPVSGGTAVNGIVEEANRCNAEYAGCKLLHREPITQLPYRDYSPSVSGRQGADVTVVATKGTQCSAANVGCEEYTNLDAVSQGGETKAYFQSIKQCVKPDNTAVTQKTYYTWVGDNDRGFVLRSYQLAANDAGAPCTKLEVSSSTNGQPRCVDDAASIAAATCTAANLESNADCTEYYDSNLNVYYRLKSKTVSVTADCHPYRNTINETDSNYSGNKGLVYYLSPKENTSCTAAAAGCRAYTGNTGQSSRNIFTDKFESSALSNWVGGEWSASSPNAGGHSILVSPVEGQTSGVAFTIADVVSKKLSKNKTYTLTLNAAAASANATNLRVFFGTGYDTSGTFDTNNSTAFTPTSGVALAWNENITPAGPEWHSYTFGPLTIDQVNSEWRLGIVISGGGAYIDNLVLTEVNDRVYMIEGSAPACPATALGCAAYKNRAGETEYLTSFARLCSSSVVGCEAMIQTQNSSTPFSQTVKGITTPADKIVTVVNDSANYCASSAKGCSMYGDPTFGKDETISGFTTVYKINDPDRYEADICLSTEDSCAAYTTSDGGTVYFKDPRTRTCEYKSGSGNSSGTWYISGTTYRCPVVTPPSSTQPIGKSCSPICSGGSRAGKPCTSDASCPGGGSCAMNDVTLIGKITNSSGQAVVGTCSDDNDCADSAQKCVYLVGICSSEANGCTEYRDPNEPNNCRSECPLELMGGTPVYVDANCSKTVCVSSDQNNRRNGQNCQSSDQCGNGGVCVGADGITPTNGQAGCRSYYYLRQSVEDTAGECNGEVNTALGCRAFNDTSNSTLNFRSE